MTILILVATPRGRPTQPMSFVDEPSKPGIGQGTGGGGKFEDVVVVESNTTRKRPRRDGSAASSPNLKAGRFANKFLPLSDDEEDDSTDEENTDTSPAPGQEAPGSSAQPAPTNQPSFAEMVQTQLDAFDEESEQDRQRKERRNQRIAGVHCLITNILDGDEWRGVLTNLKQEMEHDWETFVAEPRDVFENKFTEKKHFPEIFDEEHSETMEKESAMAFGIRKENGDSYDDYANMVEKWEQFYYKKLLPRLRFFIVGRLTNKDPLTEAEYDAYIRSFELQ